MTILSQRSRTWIGTVYEDELMPEMSNEMYDEWYAKSYLVDGIRVGPELPLDYRIKALLALRKEQWEHLQVTEGELERLLDEKAVTVCNVRAALQAAEGEGER
jgi:hypothetical protein